MNIGGLEILVCIVAIASLIFWGWSLFDVIQNRSMDDTNRIIAILLILFLGVLGSFIYLFMRDSRTSSSNYDPYDPKRYKR